MLRMAVAALLLALSAAALAQQPAAPAKSKRLALVIGNAAYRDAPLPNPLNDAADMAKALEASGFTVIRRENATLREMHLALREFGDRLDRQGTGLFYFAGHGLQVRGRNFLVPVDADIAREDEVAFAALDLAAVMEKLDSAKNPVNLVILDACRNNPFGTRFQASAKGLAQVDAPPGTLIAFATAPGSTAADGNGRNGLYTQHLVKEIERPGLAVEEVFKSVRAAVRRDSKSQQVPWESTSLESAFMFRAPAASAVPARVASAAATPSGRPPSTRSAWFGGPPALEPGDKWTYRVTNLLDQGERRYTVDLREIRGAEAHYANGAVSDIFGNYSRAVRPDGQVETFEPSNHFYGFPMKPGATWTQEVVQHVGERITYDVRVKLAVEGEEEIETALGKLRTLRMRRESHWKQRGRDNSGVNVWTYWYNANAKRFVLGEVTNTTAKGKVLQHERHELVSVTLK